MDRATCASLSSGENGARGDWCHETDQLDEGSFGRAAASAGTRWRVARAQRAFNWPMSNILRQIVFVLRGTMPTIASLKLGHAFHAEPLRTSTQHALAQTGLQTLLQARVAAGTALGGDTALVMLRTTIGRASVGLGDGRQSRHHGRGSEQCCECQRNVRSHGQYGPPEYVLSGWFHMRPPAQFADASTHAIRLRIIRR